MANLIIVPKTLGVLVPKRGQDFVSMVANSVPQVLQKETVGLGYRDGVRLCRSSRNCRPALWARKRHASEGTRREGRF